MKKNISVLYVDDEPINLILFEKKLNKKFNISTADSGFSGLEYLEANSKPDIVISDMKMPGMNGIEFIKKAKVLYPDVVFMILTGFGITEEIESALQDRLIEKYLQKPFDFNKIEKVILSETNS